MMFDLAVSSATHFSAHSLSATLPARLSCRSARFVEEDHRFRQRDVERIALPADDLVVLQAARWSRPPIDPQALYGFDHPGQWCGEAASASSVTPHRKD